MKKVRAGILSLGVMITSNGLLLLIASAIVSKTGSLPQASLALITTGVSCCSIFLGSFFSSLYLREKGILIGLLSGGLFLTVTGLAAFFLFQNGFTIGGIGKGVAILISGSLGGILGVNRKSKVKF